MPKISFAAPVLAEEELPLVEQQAFLQQQVVAAIVCGYLEHMNAAMAAGVARPGPHEGWQGDNSFLTPLELGNLIRDVRAALQAEMVGSDR